MKPFQILLAAALLFIPVTAQAAGQLGELVTYKDGDVELEGLWYQNTCNTATEAPLVLVIHQWMGITENEKMRADLLSGKCYNAFVVDMYGKGVRPADTDEAGKLATKYKSDSALARKRITAALDYAKSREGFDHNKIAALGYCFGGTMALELARTGADIDGIVSFHGALNTPQPLTQSGVIKAAVQVAHGADDPMVPPAEVDSFMKEMNIADADWSLTQYAHSVHAFTQKEAGDDPSDGVAYNEKADHRSWSAALDFLQEVFAD